MNTASQPRWLSFAIQASEDYRTFRRLWDDDNVPLCHRLHFLQMACEKFSKAHLLRRGSDPRTIQSRHQYIVTQLPLIAREIFRRVNPRTPHGQFIDVVRRIAAEVQALHPAADSGGSREENCIYPWPRESEPTIAPAQFDFPVLTELLHAPAGAQLLSQILPRAIEALIALAEPGGDPTQTDPSPHGLP